MILQNKDNFPKDKFGGLLRGVLERGAESNANNIKAGFAACGIYPLSVAKILSRLPPEKTVGEARESFSKQLAEELKRNRFGDPKKARRVKKANRLPAGASYTVSAIPVPEPQEKASPGKYQYLYPVADRYP